MEELFYIVDLRPQWKANPYITFWRPNNKGYAYPLSWAGKYTREIIRERWNYYTVEDGKIIIRFPLSCPIAEAYGMRPAPGIIDGDAGPVVDNCLLLHLKFIQERMRLEEQAEPKEI